MRGYRRERPRPRPRYGGNLVGRQAARASLPSKAAAVHPSELTEENFAPEGNRPPFAHGIVMPPIVMIRQGGIGDDVAEPLTVIDSQGTRQMAGSPSLIHGFIGIDVAAGLPGSRLSRSGSQVGQLFVDRPGTIVGLAVMASTARTAGTGTFKVRVDGFETGLQTTLDAQHTNTNRETVPPGEIVFPAGVGLDVVVSTTGDWAPTTIDVEAVVSVLLEPG